MNRMMEKIEREKNLEADLLIGMHVSRLTPTGERRGVEGNEFWMEGF